MRTTWWLITIAFAANLAARPAAAQMWFEADYLFWDRNNSSDQPYITGGAGSGDADFGFENGYRLILGGGLGNYELEGSYLSIGNWTGSGSSTQALPLAFDGTSGNLLIFPAGAGTLALPSGVRTAASSAAEATEGEFLYAGALINHAYSSNLRDVQLNFGSHRDLSPFRWGIGYRNLLINENGGVSIAGTFGALDVNDGAGPGSLLNDANDQLSDAALVAAGFTNLVGPNGYDAFNPLIPATDTLALLFAGSTENRLDGVQFTAAARTSWGDVVSLEALVRTGLFYNRINGTVSELVVGGGDDDSVYFRTLGDSTNKASFGINPALKAGLNLTDYISLTVGYEILYLTGIGLGPDQLGQVQTSVLGTPTYKVNSSGDFLAHGGSLGVEIRW